MTVLQDSPVSVAPAQLHHLLQVQVAQADVNQTVTVHQELLVSVVFVQPLLLLVQVVAQADVSQTVIVLQELLVSVVFVQPLRLHPVLQVLDRHSVEILQEILLLIVQIMVRYQTVYLVVV